MKLSTIMYYLKEMRMLIPLYILMIIFGYFSIELIILPLTAILITTSLIILIIFSTDKQTRSNLVTLVEKEK